MRCGSLLFAAAGLPLLLGAACRDAKVESSAEKPVSVRVILAEEREVPDEVSGFGSLSFLKKIDIAAPQDAVVEELPRREGSTVRKGDRLAVLGNPQIRLAVGRAENALAQASAALELAAGRLLEGEFQAEGRLLELDKGEAELAQAKREFAEQKRKHGDQEALFQAGGVTEEAIRSGRFALESSSERVRLMEQELAIRRIGFRPQDLAAAGCSVPPDGPERIRSYVRLATATLRAERSAAAARLDASAKELESAKLAEQELVVLSPASGTVGARYLEPGERVKREDKLLTIIDTSSLYAQFSVREAEALRLRSGLPARVTVDGTGGTYEGRVDLVSPTADAQSFTFTVRVLLPASPTGAKPGMFCRVVVPAGPPRSAVVVPESVLAERKDERGRLFVVAGGVVSERSVRLGGAMGDGREVLEGLDPGAVVVDRPDPSLREGDRVQALR